MSVFDILTLLGGLAMFLYGMRLMSSGLKESSSGALKRILERVTGNPLKAFLLGLVVTAIIQSSTATIVITSGLAAAGLLTLHQSLGIIIGANVGTTVTGQIIRLLDLNTSSASWLQIFKPSTLAPVAMIIGIVLIIGFHFHNSDTVGQIAMGFGILFSGLMNMTGAVDSLAESESFLNLFTHLSASPVLGYLVGLGVAFVLQSSSAAVGILQAFSVSGGLTFASVYAVIVGIYLGDCVTTAIVCSIGAKPEAKRVGIVNIIYNLCKTAVVLIGVNLVHGFGGLDFWNDAITSGGIANTNTVFNLASALLIFPLMPLFEKLTCRIIKEAAPVENPYQELLESMNPVFFATPALAFRSCYNTLLAMFRAARKNITNAIGLLDEFDADTAYAIEQEEKNIDLMTDRVSNYLVELSAQISQEEHIRILNQYYKVVSEFERLGDHAVNIAETAADLRAKNCVFSDEAHRELKVLSTLLERVMDYTEHTFEKRDAVSANHIEPLEEVVDDVIAAMRDDHFLRLRNGTCSPEEDANFLNLMTDLERVSDICSNVGVATLTRIYPELASKSHDYIASLHMGSDNEYNRIYQEAHKNYIDLLQSVSSTAAENPNVV